QSTTLTNKHRGNEVSSTPLLVHCELPSWPRAEPLPCVSRSLSLSRSLSHTHTHTRKLAHTNIHAYTVPERQTGTHTYTHTQSVMITHTQTRTHQQYSVHPGLTAFAPHTDRTPAEVQRFHQLSISPSISCPHYGDKSMKWGGKASFSED